MIPSSGAAGACGLAGSFSRLVSMSADQFGLAGGVADVADDSAAVAAGGVSCARSNTGPSTSAVTIFLMLQYCTEGGLKDLRFVSNHGLRRFGGSADKHRGIWGHRNHRVRFLCAPRFIPVNLFLLIDEKIVSVAP